MLELDELEQAGVFSPSAVTVDDLLGEALGTSANRPISTVQRLAPLAAAAAVVTVAVCGWIFGLDSATRSGPGPFTDAAPSAGSGNVETIQDCMVGPTQTLPAGCDEFDFDRDGSVTLADFGAYQVAYADVTR